MKKHRANKFKTSPRKDENVKVKNWIERNPSLSQFMITLFTIIITSIFSYHTLTQTSSMFNYSRRKDSLADIQDSIKQLKLDKFTSKQQQLLANQNKFIEGQLLLQSDQYKMQRENEKVMLIGDTIQFRDRKNGNGEYYFLVKNKGKRTAFISRILFAMYNVKDSRYMVSNNPERIQVVYDGGYTIAQYLPNDLTINANTVCIMRVFFKDNGIDQYQDMAFIVNADRFPKLTQAPVTKSVRLFVFDKIKSYLKNSSQYFNDPDFDGSAEFIN